MSSHLIVVCPFQKLDSAQRSAPFASREREIAAMIDRVTGNKPVPANIRREPLSDIDTAAVDSLKTLDPNGHLEKRT